MEYYLSNRQTVPLKKVQVISTQKNQETDALTGKDLATEQRRKVKKVSNSGIDLFNNSKKKSPLIPVSRPLPTVTFVSFGERRASYIERYCTE